MSNNIPPITGPLGKNWQQPNVGNILVDDSHAVMDRRSFDALATYSNSVPSGIYPGKMWKAIADNGHAFLRWYGIIEGRNDICSCNQREILIVELP